MIKEFKSFALRGNLLELAVAFILGGAFALLVQNLVANVLMPLIAAVVGQPSFDDLTLTVGDGVIYYGRFLTALVNFLIIAFVLFLLIRSLTRLTRRPDEEPKQRECPHCLSMIPVGARRCSACTSEVGAIA